MKIRRLTAFIFSIFSIFIFSGLCLADSGQSSDQTQIKYKETELLVKFKSDVSEKTKDNLHGRLGSKKIHDFSYLRIHHVKLKEGTSVEDAIGQYSADSNVEYAEPNYIVYADELIPNDTYFNELWGLRNTGQGGGTPGADISAAGAWSLTTGSSSIVVAVIDTGIDYTHEDISANIWINTGEYNGRKNKDDDGNGYVDDIYGIDTFNNDSNPMDDHGHGTHVAGTIGAAGNNGIGIAGINWRVKVMACKFIGAGGSGTVDGAIKCLEYVRAMKAKGVNVITTNNSWGGGGYSQALYDAINAQREILFIAAAGNSSYDNDLYPHYPSSYDLPNVIAVAATDRNDLKTDFSNYGRRSVHIGAPGADIVSLRAKNTDMYDDGLHFIPAGDQSAKYYIASGTSMATPHVSGLAALIKSQDMTKDWKYVKNRILSGGDTISSLNGLTVTGRRVNAYNSLICSNRPVFSVLNHPFTLTIGQQETLSALSINCESPVGPVTVTLLEGEVIELLDNGISPDLAAGDGIFSASWTPSRKSEYLTFSSTAGSESFSIPALSVTTSILLEANTRYNYSQTLKATGGLPPYTWSILSGSLPDGLTLNSSTGEISGIPVTTGIFNFTVQVMDSVSSTASKYFTIPVVDDRVVTEWLKVYEDALYSNGNSIAVDRNSNIYVLGWTYNGLTYDELIIKYDSSGNVVWEKTIAGVSGVGISVDSSGNVYAAGTSNYDYHTVKLDPYGTVMWSKIYSTANMDTAYGIAVDGNGNVYVTGRSYNQANFNNDYLTIKYDSQGYMIWAKTYGSASNEYGYSAAVDQVGNVYVTGDLSNGTGYDCLTVEYDADGNVLRTQTYPGGNCTGIAIDINNNIYLAGYANNDFLTIKYDPQMNLLWARGYNGIQYDAAKGIAVDASGNVYVTGNSYGLISPTQFVFDSLTISYDPLGSLLWTRLFNSGNTVFTNGIAVDTVGDVYLTGYIPSKCFTIKYHVD